jgi:hypothetical protein
MYVDKVIIHKDKVELVFKFHPDLTPPRDDKRCGAANLYADSDKNKKHTGLTQTLDNPCVLRGGEHGKTTKIQLLIHGNMQKSQKCQPSTQTLLHKERLF